MNNLSTFERQIEQHYAYKKKNMYCRRFFFAYCSSKLPNRTGNGMLQCNSEKTNELVGIIQFSE